MIHKKAFKKVETSFQHRTEYEKFHEKAKEVTQTDNRLTDSAFIKICIREGEKKIKRAARLRAKALVLNQERYNQIRLNKDIDSNTKLQIDEIEKESISLWDF